MADAKNRPLSPHLQIYRPQLTSLLSVVHRGTGVVLGVGTLLLAWWLIAAAMGPAAFETVQWFNGSWIGRLVLLGFTFSLFYHLCNGIRHLFWDMGAGFEIKTVNLTGWLVLVASTGLTGLTWILGYAVRGGVL
jgi:succinate dehydrogenase / fumarate reductase cytochrome b subunit